LFNCGIDVFKFGQGQGKSLSDGGIAVKYRYDDTVDYPDTPLNEWKSDRFVCTYRYRPSTVDEFCDDALMVCQYYGAYAMIETNVTAALDYFNRTGYSGLLKYLRDKSGGWKKTAGIYLGEEGKQEEFNLIRVYIKRRGANERHLDFLLECKHIPTPQDLTKYDLLAACGAALVGETVNLNQVITQSSSNTQVLRRRNYSVKRY